MKMRCILCPLGCELDVKVTNDIVEVSGNRCPRGKNYAEEEIKNPKRPFFTVIKTNSEQYHVIAVRSQAPIPKENIKDAVETLSKLIVNDDVEVGEKIAEFKGIPIIVTRKKLQI